MAHYRSVGEIPPKRHTQFRRPDGRLYSEEVFGTEGFVGPTSTLYHINPPTQVHGGGSIEASQSLSSPSQISSAPAWIDRRVSSQSPGTTA